MKKFVFQFDSLLKLRNNRRQLCRQALAKLLQNQQQLRNQLQELHTEHEALLEQMRTMNQQGHISINQAANRRYYAGQLKITMQSIRQQQSDLAEQLEQCRQTLVKADQDVKALEQLAEKQQDNFQYEQLKKEAHELEETWLASQQREPIS